MANELDITEEGVVSLTQNQGLGEVIKPLVREVHLLDSYIAGTSHLKDKTVLDEIREGEELTLRREDNKYDSNAIMILTAGGKKVGYVPEMDNLVFARLMNAGKLLKAKITKIGKRKNFTQVSIGIYLVDF